jgi:outer membrane protein OmpA-like peptidoglycan-associated protein
MEALIIKTLVAFALIIFFNQPTTKVTLLPSDNEESQIIVSNDSGEQVVDKVGDAVSVDSKTENPSTPSAVELEQLKLKHSSLFAIQPQKVETFLLYFENNSTTLLPKSQLLIANIIEVANERSFPQINVIGHADAAGNSEYNMKISYQRASAVLELLKSKNTEEAEYRIDSYGENDPLIKSGNETEPRNRRVEIQIW